MASMAKNDYHEIAQAIMNESTQAKDYAGDKDLEAEMIEFVDSGQGTPEDFWEMKGVDLSAQAEAESGDKAGFISDESGDPNAAAFAERDAQAAAIEPLWQRFEANEDLSPEEYKTLIQYMRDVGSERGEDEVRLRSNPEQFMNDILEYADEDEIAYLNSLSPEEQQALMAQIADSDGLGRVRSFMPKQ